jgi:hypothetical protein
MTRKRYMVVCRECGDISADTTDDGAYSEAKAHRRAGHHEGSTDHSCTVEVVGQTPEYRCPVCNKLCTGKQERDKHAKSEPGVSPDSFYRV